MHKLALALVLALPAYAPPAAAPARAANMALAPARATTIAPTVAPDGDYVKPVPGPIIRHFEAPPTPYTAGHRGIDIETPFGTEVVASADGTVHFAGQVGGQLFVSIDHADGIKTTYSFLSVVLVRAGAWVAQGQVIARTGAGHPGEPPDHLHFGALRDDAYIDPEPLIVTSLRKNLWRVIALAPVEDEPTGGASP
jgi:murein DD-endopeptidase MepM/ murein hydrolase activator NlpD